MKILIIEPFFSGSHKSWAENYVKHSKHDVDILSLPGRFWKWRMHGGAITLAKKYNRLQLNPSIILATGMLNLPVFMALTKPRCPVAIYFHENQFTYPWSKYDKDVELQRDKHYGFINYSSALAADCLFFNSKFHFESFFPGLEKFLSQFPDYKGIGNVQLIYEKSEILHLGLNLEKLVACKIEKHNNDLPIILWNHRWEYDKNPTDFFDALNHISKIGLDFHLVVLGNEFKREMPSFTHARNTLKRHIIQFGYTETFEDYAAWLWKADILPVTSIQDFFGISIMEAVFCNTIPLLPQRLSYPELFRSNENPEIFYHSKKDLINKLEILIHNIALGQNQKLYNNIPIKYDWEIMSPLYDDRLEKLLVENRT